MRHQIVALAAAMCLGGGFAASGDQIMWQNGHLIFNRFGSPVPEGSGWLIQLYKDGGNNTIDPFGSGDDILIAGATATFDLGPDTDGYFYKELDPVALGINVGDKVFTRVFDAPTIAAAQYYVDLGNPAYLAVVQNSAVPNPPWDYNSTDLGSASDGSDWKPVPEPGVLGLMAIGALVVARRRRSK